MIPLDSLIAERMGCRYVRLVGRGITAEYVALRALALLNSTPPGAVILPDLICVNVLDGALLAGYRPNFGDVGARYTLDLASLPQTITDDTQVVLYAHTFGYHAAIDHSAPAGNLVYIEDAVQGLGGSLDSSPQHRPPLTFISFDQTKMISGRGGAILTDDPVLWDAISRVDLNEVIPPRPVDSPRIRAYRAALNLTRHDLIRPFDAAPDNIARIAGGWARLESEVRIRNEQAAWLRDHLTGLPLDLPPILPGDAIWRYTIAAPSRLWAHRVLQALAAVGLRASDNYPALSGIFSESPNPISGALSGRLLNLWVGSGVTLDELRQTVRVVKKALAGL